MLVLHHKERISPVSSDEFQQQHEWRKDPNMCKLPADPGNVADALLINLEDTLGIRVFEALITKISLDYLGGEMDVHTAIIERPDLFERALIGVLGCIGERILAHIWCLKLRKQFRLDPSLTYHKAGDLVRCIEGIRE
jgi:RecB family endonuclease NucS